MRQDTIMGVKIQKQLRILHVMACVISLQVTLKMWYCSPLLENTKLNSVKLFARNATLGPILGEKYRCIHYKQYTTCKTA